MSPKKRKATGKNKNKSSFRILRTPNSKEASMVKLLSDALDHLRSGDLSSAKQLYLEILEKDPDNVEANHLLGVVSFQVGENDTAVRLIRKAVLIHPGYANAHMDLGIILNTLGRSDEAVKSYKNVLLINPKDVKALLNIGNAFMELERFDKAIASYKQALSIHPEYAEAYSNIGNALEKTGDVKNALICYEKALAINPNFTDAHNGMGIVLKETKRFSDAISSFNKALAIQPDFFEAHYNLADTLKIAGKTAQAIKAYINALHIRPDHPEALRAFAALNKGVKIAFQNKKPDSAFKDLLARLLAREDIHHQDIFHTVLIHLFNRTVVEEIQEFLASIPSNKNVGSFLNNEILLDLITNDLFLSLLKKTIIADPLAETFLTKIRKSITLLFDSKTIDIAKLIRIESFVYALAHQCFWNEYVFSQSQEEMIAIDKIHKHITQANWNPDNGSLLYLCILSCYAPLYEYNNLDWLRSKAGKINYNFSDLLKIQLDEPQKEKELSNHIKLLSPIKDQVSQKIRKQYTVHPYPRWIGMYRINPEPFEKNLSKAIFPNRLPNDIQPIKEPSVLIAGCGTGQHPIICAQTYKNASILAIDLSLPSLAYAKRKADELEISNIEFMQADILDLVLFKKQFDIIESVGVLHHMGDPVKGWRILADTLKSKGFMKIGLYSQYYRKYVTEIRSFIKKGGYLSTIDGIRECRQSIFLLPDDNIKKKATSTNDFYSTSTIRDLLFNEQEHLFSLPEINRILKELELTFLGFVMGNAIKQNYGKQFPKDKDCSSLENWNNFEINNVETFALMYQFWVQKTKS